MTTIANYWELQGGKPSVDEMLAKMRGKEDAVTGALLARIDPEIARLVVGLKAASQQARRYLTETAEELATMQKDLDEAQDTAIRWFMAASPYATPGSLKEALNRSERIYSSFEPEGTLTGKPLNDSHASGSPQRLHIDQSIGNPGTLPRETYAQSAIEHREYERQLLMRAVPQLVGLAKYASDKLDVRGPKWLAEEIENHLRSTDSPAQAKS